MSEAQEIDSPIAKSEENINYSDSTSVPAEDHITNKSANEEDPETRKSESIEESINCEDKEKDNETSASVDKTSRKDKSTKRDESIVVSVDETPGSPVTKTHGVNKAGECNLLPVLVEQLRSALEQSCSSQSSSEEQIVQPEDSGIDSEEDLRVWASGLCGSMEQQQRRLENSPSPRGLKLDLKFLEDLLLSDIQTALGRLQETLKRADIGTLTRYSSTLDPTNKLNLLRLISSLLANLKIPEESIVKPEKSLKSSSVGARRRRTDRHTIGVSTEELARARKWLEDKSVGKTAVVEPTCSADPSKMENDSERHLENCKIMENRASIEKIENSMDRLDSQCRDQQYEKVPEKYMKDALNQQQSLQNKSSKDTSCSYHEKTGTNNSVAKLIDTAYKDDNTIINEEYGITASSLYHQSNAQAKCNKFLAKKSKIKRANTIDIPNYLKLRAESLANNGHAGGTLRRPINIGDKYSRNGGNVIPSFEPKTENDRKFLALINKNNESPCAAASTSLPFKTFNYRNASTLADKNWNSRFSNIKTTFDKPRSNVGDDDYSTTRGTNETRRKSQPCEREIVAGSPRLPCNANKEKFAVFSHAPTSPFRKIEKSDDDETTGGFVKSGYLPKNGGTLRAKVKIFDQENVNSTVGSNFSQLPTRSCAKRQFNGKRGSSVFHDTDDRGIVNSSENTRITENGHLNYHSFCKQFAPFATKNPSDNQKSAPWSSGIINNASKTRLDEKTRERFETTERKVSSQFTNENKIETKVPVACQSGIRCVNNDDDDKEISRHRKFYETYEGHVGENDTTNSRDIVAYPFEINYQKRPAFGQRLRDVTSEKGDREDPEIVRQEQPGHSYPVSSKSSLRYIKSAVPSTINASSPQRDTSSMQSVAVQTHRSEPVRSFYTNDDRSYFSSRNEIFIPRRTLPAVSLSNDTKALKTQNLPDEQTKRHVNENEPRAAAAAARRYHDTYQQSSFQRDTDLSRFAAHRANYPAQGRQNLPQNATATSHASHPANYPPGIDYKSQYCPIAENETQASVRPEPPQIPPRANPPQKPISSILKNQREQNDNCDRLDKRTHEELENRDITKNYSDRYGETIFHRENKNPIYAPPDRDNGEIEKFNDNSSIDQFSDSSPTITYHREDNCNTVEPKSYRGDQEFTDITEDRLFIDDENIQNQDISSTEGVVTRYACAIATVSPVPESPILSPLSLTLEDTNDTRTSRILDESSAKSIQHRDNEIIYHAGAVDEEEKKFDKEDLSLERIRRHNLLQQNLIRQLQDGQSRVSNLTTRESRETPCADDTTSIKFNYPMKLQTDNPAAVPKVSRGLSQEKQQRDETTFGNHVYTTKLPEIEQNTTAETVMIESNNTQEKINIFEGRSDSSRNHQRQFKPLSIPRGERDTFVTPKINIVSPSKVFKPSFKGDSDFGSYGRGIDAIKLPRKISNTVDSSDEYLMSCASKPSRSIVLSKSESWHQLALSKSTLQVPQAQSCALLKPPKPKSPSSIKLSKQYEASSSSDSIRKMEDKIQRYFNEPSSIVQADSSIAATRREPKTKRNFNSRKSQGILMRSHTMPHIYDETTDVEKAFDSLFKEATRSDNRY